MSESVSDVHGPAIHSLAAIIYSLEILNCNKIRIALSLIYRLIEPHVLITRHISQLHTHINIFILVLHRLVYSNGARFMIHP